MTTPDDDRARYVDINRIREFSPLFVAHVASILGAAAPWRTRRTLVICDIVSAGIVAAWRLTAPRATAD